MMSAKFRIVSRVLTAFGLAAVAAPGLAQNTSTPAAPAPSPAAHPAAAPTPAAPKTKAAKKKKKTTAKKPAAAKKPAPVEDEAPQGPVTETTKIIPNITYRVSSMQKRESSAYWKPEYKDSADQLYATIRFERTYDFRHDVVLEPTFRTVRTNPKRMDEVVLEQAYIESAPFKKLNLFVTGGKKTEYEGSGFMVNPSDLLNEDKDLFDPLYQREGKTFVRARYRFENASLGLGVIPKRAQEAKRGSVWLQGSAEIGEAELKLQMMHQEFDKTTTGLSASYFLHERVELHWDGRYQTHQRNPTEVGQRFMTYSSYKYDDPSMYFAAGTRLVITSRRTFIAEGIQQQSGLTSDEFVQYFTVLKDEQEQQGKVEDIPTRLQGRRYGFVSYQDDETVQGSHIGASYLQNVNDQSWFGTANYHWHFSPISSLELNTMLFQGTTNSEFGEMPFPRAVTLIFRGKF